MKSGHEVRGHLGVKKYIFLHNSKTKGQFELGVTLCNPLGLLNLDPNFDLGDLW